MSLFCSNRVGMNTMASQPTGPGPALTGPLLSLGPALPLPPCSHYPVHPNAASTPGPLHVLFQVHGFSPLFSIHLTPLLPRVFAQIFASH